jgi:hypothetical protein
MGVIAHVELAIRAASQGVPADDPLPGHMNLGPGRAITSDIGGGECSHSLCCGGRLPTLLPMLAVIAASGMHRGRAGAGPG